MEDASQEKTAASPPPRRRRAGPFKRLKHNLSRAAEFLSLRRLRDESEGYLLLLAVIVGLLMGLISALFRYLLHASHEFFQQTSQRHDIGLVTVLLPAFGGLLVGFVIYRLLHIEGGHGVPSVMKAFAVGNFRLSPWMAVKSGSSIVTVASGGSAGQEGPILEIGSVVGSMFAQLMRLTREQMGTLVGCGAAAGMAGIFNAPIGAVFLALELLLRDLTVRAFGPIVIAAVVASVTSGALLPNQPLFSPAHPDALATIHPIAQQLAMFGVLGILCGLVGALFVVTLYRMHDFFAHLKMPRWLKPALGGLCVGVVGLAFPNVISEGYAYVNLNILQSYDPSGPGAVTTFAALTFLFVALVKILVTSFTLGSGGTGGTFAPAMVVGAMTGAGFGVLCNRVMPEYAASPTIFALAGMAGCVASSLHIRIAALLLIYEISGAEYRMVLPLMVCVALASLVAGALGQGSVYTLSLLRDGFDIESEHRKAANPLQRVQVRSIMNVLFTRLNPSDNLSQVMEAFSTSEDEAFVVIDDNEELYGVIMARDLRGLMNMGDLGQAIIASDAAETNPPILYPDSPASDALTIFSHSDLSGIPVLAAPGSRRVVGLISRLELLRAYREQSTVSRDSA